MNRDKVYFAAGLLMGIALTALFFAYLAPRYTVTKVGDTSIRQDTWTGQSWRMVDNEWRPIKGVKRDWDRIDQALNAALRIPAARGNTETALERLKEHYPVLKELSDEELSERIKVIYSKHILYSLYLENFLKMQEGK
ncbi:MAG: hypothetical protein JXL84_23785 [Deltaproteobacteria bacterium]|nr:hypothetical protein [Deltaproteobacteria bacterium]